ncbi:helicase-related protein [Vibrio chagasii]|nr:helicase-related protein [Vibrio chagasii]
MLLLHHQPESAVVFCNTKKEVQNASDELSHRGFSVIELRLATWNNVNVTKLFGPVLRNKTISILVATDVAARGLDVDNLDAVFNFEVISRPEVHVHRNWSYGRAGNKGVAISFSLLEKRCTVLLKLMSTWTCRLSHQVTGKTNC